MRHFKPLSLPGHNERHPMTAQDTQVVSSQTEDCQDEQFEKDGEVTRSIRNTLQVVQDSLQEKRSARATVARLASQPHFAKRK